MTWKRRLVAFTILFMLPLSLTTCGGSQRLRLDSGTMASEAKALGADEVHQYTLRAAEGEILAVRVVSPGGHVHLSLSDKDEALTLVHPASKATSWTGLVPATEDYVVTVTGSRGDDDYVLAVARLAPTVEGDQVPFAGVYHAQVPQANAMKQLTLWLNADGTSALIGLAGAQSLRPFVMQGNWQVEGNAATIELSEQDGEPFRSPEIIRLEKRGGRLVATDKGTNDIHSWRTAGLWLAPALGDYHPMVRELHTRLVDVGFLSTVNPGPRGDIFDETTRQAVLAYQSEQGLQPSGIAGAATWAALDIALLPERTSADEPILYLTFDDGPDGRYTPQILDLLARYDAQATFFILGEQAAYYPDVIRAEAQAGHYLANHGFAHHTFEDMSRDELFREIQKTEKLLRDAAGDLFAWGGDIHFVRPPYGLTDANTQEYAADMGYVMVMWDVDSQDWQLPGAYEIAWNVLNQAQPGDIVLMHDGGGDRTQTILALEIILQEYSAQGYRFRSIFGNQ